MPSQSGATATENTNARRLPDGAVWSGKEYQAWYWEEFAARMRRENFRGIGRPVKQGRRTRMLWARWTEVQSEWDRRFVLAIRFASLLSDSRPARRLFLMVQSFFGCLLLEADPKAPGSHAHLIAVPQAEGTSPAGGVRFAARPCTPHAP